jgi:hypothetical protein
MYIWFSILLCASQTISLAASLIDKLNKVFDICSFYFLFIFYLCESYDFTLEIILQPKVTIEFSFQ